MKKYIMARIREEEEKDMKKVMQYAIKRIKTKEREERRRKINGSNYNRKYIRAMVEDRPEYLIGKRKKKDRCLIQQDSDAGTR